MPLYEFRCECGDEEEILLPFEHPEQICKCGKVMQLKVSHSNFTMKPTGNQMALDSLNSKGSGFPLREDGLRAKGIRDTFAGTQKPPQTVW